MKNFKLTLQYDGSRYNGWQRQTKTKNTIQGKIEQVLSLMTGHAVEINGAGRTDSGVHAAAQIANVKINTPYSASEVMAYLNHYLPADIAVTACEEAPERFHARLNAHGKTYRYRLCDGGEKPDVFARRYVCPWEQHLDVQAMQEAAELLCGTHDFRAFSSVNRRFKKSTVRTVHRIDIQRLPHELALTFSGDGFLYHMVRILTGTLVEIGAGERSLDSIAAAFETGDRQLAGITMPPNGLILLSVDY